MVASGRVARGGICIFLPNNHPIQSERYQSWQLWLASCFWCILCLGFTTLFILSAIEMGDDNKEDGGILSGSNDLGWTAANCTATTVATNHRKCDGDCKSQCTYMQNSNSVNGIACCDCSQAWTTWPYSLYVTSAAFTGTQEASKCGYLPAEGSLGVGGVPTTGQGYAESLEAKVNTTDIPCWHGSLSGVVYVRFSSPGSCNDEHSKVPTFNFGLMLALVVVFYGISLASAWCMDCIPKETKEAICSPCGGNSETVSHIELEDSKAGSSGLE